MLHRVSKVAFGGMWVFPGGRVDDDDRRPGDDDAGGGPARRRPRGAGGVRPRRRPGRPRAVLPLGAAAHHARGASPRSSSSPGPATARSSSTAARSTSTSGSPAREVLARRDRGEVDLAPPTWVTLHDLAAARRRRRGPRERRASATRSPTTRPAGSRSTAARWRCGTGDGGYDDQRPGPARARATASGCSRTAGASSAT